MMISVTKFKIGRPIYFLALLANQLLYGQPAYSNSPEFTKKGLSNIFIFEQSDLSHMPAGEIKDFFRTIALYDEQNESEFSDLTKTVIQAALKFGGLNFTDLTFMKNTPLLFAIANAKPKIGEFIISLKSKFPVDPDKTDFYQKSTPLILAVAKGADYGMYENESGQVIKPFLSIIQTLLKQGADPNKENQGGMTPLHFALAHRDLEVIELLLSYGARWSDYKEVRRSHSEISELPYEYALSFVREHVKHLNFDEKTTWDIKRDSILKMRVSHLEKKRL